MSRASMWRPWWRALRNSTKLSLRRGESLRRSAPCRPPTVNSHERLAEQAIGEEDDARHEDQAERERPPVAERRGEAHLEETHRDRPERRRDERPAAAESHPDE